MKTEQVSVKSLSVKLPNFKIPANSKWLLLLMDGAMM